MIDLLKEWFAQGEGDSDFRVRSQEPFFSRLITIFGLAFAVLFVAAYITQSGGMALYAVALFMVIGALGWFTSYFVISHRDAILAVEFQNTLFSAAAGINQHYCLIIKQDGTIINFDPGFRTFFPEASRQYAPTIDNAFTQAGIPEEAIQEVYDCISSGESGRVILQKSEEDTPSLLSIDPLPRPKGYWVLRARDYVEKRNRDAAPEIVAATTSKAKPTYQAPANQNAQGFQYFIEHSPIAIARLNSNGDILECNQSFRDLARFRDLDYAPTNLLTLLDTNNREDVDKALKQLVAGQEVPMPLDVKISHEQSAATASLYLTRTDIGPSGQPDIISHLIDTTEQKNLEMRFAHSQKMQAVGQLAGGVAHDFNNLLTAMIGFCDLLLMRHPAGDPSFADIMQVKQNANRAANLVRQLLAFSRRQTLQPKTLDVTDVLAELSNLIRRLIGENIELKVVHGRDVGMIKADQGQMEQVFINLAVNARDAMPKGGTLTITTSHVKVDRFNPLPRDLIAPSGDEQIVPGEYVLVEIADTGTGIPQDIIQKIFEPFFSTKEVGAGTGLGLATCYGIVKQTGGYIFVASKPNMGTTFRLYFKYYSAAEATVTPSAEQVERVTHDDLTGKGTILLVEDETPVRSFAARALRNKGYTVLEADCGETALEVMEADGDKVEVIISDVIMPGMNGPMMIEEIGKKYPALKPKVIFISGYAEDAFGDSFAEGHEINFLPKPFTLKQLASKVKDVMGK